MDEHPFTPLIDRHEHGPLNLGIRCYLEDVGVRSNAPREVSRRSQRRKWSDRSRDAPVYANVLARDVGAAVGREKGNDAGDFAQ